MGKYTGAIKYRGTLDKGILNNANTKGRNMVRAIKYIRDLNNANTNGGKNKGQQK